MICVPIIGPSVSKAQEQIASASAVADILELRLDLIDPPDLNILLDSANLPVIVTNRSKRDGGQFKGSDEERLQSLRKALKAGADYVDIEVSTPREHLQPFLEEGDPSRIIISYHDFSHTPEDFNPLYFSMFFFPFFFIYIVSFALVLSDFLLFFFFLFLSLL